MARLACGLRRGDTLLATGCAASATRMSFAFKWVTETILVEAGTASDAFSAGTSLARRLKCRHSVE